MGRAHVANVVPTGWHRSNRVEGLFELLLKKGSKVQVAQGLLRAVVQQRAKQTELRGELPLRQRGAL